MEEERELGCEEREHFSLAGAAGARQKERRQAEARVYSGIHAYRATGPYLFPRLGPQGQLCLLLSWLLWSWLSGSPCCFSELRLLLFPLLGHEPLDSS